MVQAVLERTDGKGTAYVFETAGNPITTNAAAGIVKRGGKIVMVGQVHQPVTYDFFEVNSKEADIINVFRYANIYPMALEAVKSGRVDVKRIVSKIFLWENTQEAYECALYDKKDAVKVVIECK